MMLKAFGNKSSQVQVIEVYFAMYFLEGSWK